MSLSGQNVNTDTTKLWVQYKTDKGVKKQLVMHYLYLVNRIVMRMMPTYGGYVEMDDLISCGIIGLMDAIDKYDMDKNTDFEVFSKRRIGGEIIDSLRKLDWASVSLRGRIKEMNNAIEELQVSLKREPTDEEVAMQMGLSIDKLYKVKAQVHTFNMVHFESLINSSDSGGVSIGELVQDENTSDLSDDMQRDEFIEMLGQQIDSLSEKEQQVIKLYYYEELKFKEIAQILDVSESRISQIHSNALSKLRKGLKNYEREEEGFL